MHPDQILLPRDADEGGDLALGLLRLLARGGEVRLSVRADEYHASLDGAITLWASSSVSLTQAVRNLEAPSLTVRIPERA